MSATRILGAGLLGGVVMFAWGAFSHMVLPLGEVGVRPLPSDDVLMPQLKAAVNEPGFYFFPGMDTANESAEAIKAWEEKCRAGPRGVVIMDPKGAEPMSPSQLGMEFGSNVLAALLAAVILARISGGTGTRTMMGTLMGVTAWAAIDVSYWNWYMFPTNMMLAQLVENGIGFLFTSAVIAWVLGRGMKRPAY